MTNLKKVSASSMEKQPQVNGKIEKCAEREPEDKYYVVHFLFLLLGLLHFMPYSFFVTANAYWMEKFRNVSADASDASARAILQSHFASAGVICNSIPFTIFMVLSTTLGYKLRARTRVLCAIATMTTCFIVATGFIKINTDSWQTLFFGVTMGTLAIINGSNAVLEIGNLVLLSKFPQSYMKGCLYGQGFAGIFNSTLQIITLAAGTSTTASALMYFVFGSSVMLFTLILFYSVKYNNTYNYYVEKSVEDTKREILSLAEMKALLKKIWPLVVIFVFYDLTKMPTHTAVTSLIVSEYYGNGNLWNDTYFVPVITFLFSDLCTLGGRFIQAKLNKVYNGMNLTIFMFLRMVILVPLIFFCNAQPRSHLPILLPHDWEYIIIICLFSVTNGFFLNMVYLNVAKLVEPDEVEGAFMVLMTCFCFISAILSPIGLFSVDVL